MSGLEATARRIGHYKWVEMRLFEVLGAWVPNVPEQEVKLRLGTDAHHHAWHAELWHKCLPEGTGLASPEELTVPADDGLVAFVEALGKPEAPELTIEKLTGVYRVLVPHMVTAYSRHLEAASPATDGPVIRALQLILRDELDDWRAGEMLLQSLLRSAENVERAASHQATLEKLLLDAAID